MSKLTLSQKCKIDTTKSCTVRMYNDSAREITMGEIALKMINPKTEEKFKVVCNIIDDTNCYCTPIIGSSAAQAMNLVEIKHENICKISSTVPDSCNTGLSENVILSQYKDVFTGQGRLR